MSKRTKGSLRSSRGGFFSEPERRSPEKRRLQRVRFRRRYASSVMKRTWINFLKVAGGTLVIAGLIYGGVSSWRFWGESSSLRVSAIKFEGDIPPTLAAQFPVKSGAHLFKANLKKVEESLIPKFPELSELRVSRGLDRSLVVTGRYKEARAFYEFDGKTMGVMNDGTLFPLAAHNQLQENLVVMAGKTSSAARLQQLHALSEWEKNVPEFWTLVKRVETDNIGAVRVVLEGGIVVQWGEMKDNELLIHARNILDVLERFTPAHTPALLRVISTNRVVMDSNWKQK